VTLLAFSIVLLVEGQTMTVQTLEIILYFEISAFCILSWVASKLYRKAANKTKELWKTYAIAQEVIAESLVEYGNDVFNEGCMTRSKRRAKVLLDLHNARSVATLARDKLVKLGEYQ